MNNNHEERIQTLEKKVAFLTEIIEKAREKKRRSAEPLVSKLPDWMLDGEM